MSLRVNSCSMFFASAIFFGDASFADAVSESLQKAMRDCVSMNANRIGSPISDTESWARFVGSVTSISFSFVNLAGLDGHPDIQSALIAKTTQLLITELEQRGFKSFRGQAIDAVEYCVPFSLQAASNEVERQAVAVCPDDTDYRTSVENITATEAELASEYGKYASDIRRNELYSIRIHFYTAFPEVFNYGEEDDYPKLGKSEDAAELDSQLSTIAGTASGPRSSIISIMISKSIRCTTTSLMKR